MVEAPYRESPPCIACEAREARAAERLRRIRATVNGAGLVSLVLVMALGATMSIVTWRERRARTDREREKMPSIGPDEPNPNRVNLTWENHFECHENVDGAPAYCISLADPHRAWLRLADGTGWVPLELTHR